uniref:DUF2428 domain-containing protein n=1 Tax=Mesocestoides corti TaxID=53468 RepID=A0A5K3F291_MESCO
MPPESLKCLASNEILQSLECWHLNSLEVILCYLKGFALKEFFRILTEYAHKANWDNVAAPCFDVVHKVSSVALKDAIWSEPDILDLFSRFLVHVFEITRCLPSRPVQTTVLVKILSRLAEIGGPLHRPFAQKTALNLFYDTSFRLEFLNNETAFSNLILPHLRIFGLNASTKHSDSYLALSQFKKAVDLITQLAGSVEGALDFVDRTTSLTLSASLLSLHHLLSHDRQPRRQEKGGHKTLPLRACFTSLVRLCSLLVQAGKTQCIRDGSRSILKVVFHTALPALSRRADGWRDYRSDTCALLITIAGNVHLVPRLIKWHLPHIIFVAFSITYAEDQAAWCLIREIVHWTLRFDLRSLSTADRVLPVWEQLIVLWVFAFGFGSNRQHWARQAGWCPFQSNPFPANACCQSTCAVHLVHMAARLAPTLFRRGNRTHWGHVVWAALIGLLVKTSPRPDERIFHVIASCVSSDTGLALEEFKSCVHTFLLTAGSQTSRLQPVGQDCLFQGFDMFQQPWHLQLSAPSTAVEQEILGTAAQRVPVDASAMRIASAYFETVLSSRWAHLHGNRTIDMHEHPPLPLLTILHLIHGCRWSNCAFLSSLPDRIFAGARSTQLSDFVTNLIQMSNFFILTPATLVQSYLMTCLLSSTWDDCRRKNRVIQTAGLSVCPTPEFTTALLYVAATRKLSHTLSTPKAAFKWPLTEAFHALVSAGEIKLIENILQGFHNLH